MVAASLSLLKGAKASETKTEAAPEQKKSNVQIAKKPAPVEVAPAVQEPEAVVIDIDKMTSKQIDELIKEHEVEVPGEWTKFTVAQKRKWLNENMPQAEDPTASLVPEAEPETKTGKELGPTNGTGKEVVKATGKEVVAPLSGEVMGPDAITDLVHEIENLKEKEARLTVHQLSEMGELNYFKLGGVLSLIQVNQWYSPYASLRELIENEYGMEYRRAMYWVQIYNSLVESKVPYHKVAKVGWTKLKEIARVITPENVDDWVKVALEQPTATLIETVRNSIKAATGQAQLEDGTSTTKTVTVKTFKVHDDQLKNIDAALEKAKEVAGTTVDTVALEFICLDYLGGTGGKLPSLSEQMKGDGSEAALEATLNALAEAFPEYNFKVETP